MTAVEELAGRIRRAMTGGSFPPERFSVVRASPLVLDGLQTDLRLEDGDDDFEPGAVSGLPLAPGDVVLVQPEPDPEDPSLISAWIAVSVVDGPAPGAGAGDVTQAQLDAAVADLEAQIASEALTRGAADSSEASTRSNADVALQAALDAEEAARIAADGDEANARSTADAAIQAELDAHEADVALDGGPHGLPALSADGQAWVRQGGALVAVDVVTQAELVGAGTYSASLGAGTVFDVAHGLGTLNVQAFVRRLSDGSLDDTVSRMVLDANTVRLTFDAAIAADAFAVVVMAAAGAEGLTTAAADARYKPLYPPTVNALPSSPTNGEECFYKVGGDPKKVWHLKYDSAIVDGYPWVCLGGPVLYAEVETDQARNNTSYGSLATAGPSITPPLSGEYMVAIGFACWHDGALARNEALMSYAIGATAASDNDACTNGHQNTQSVVQTAMRERRKVLAAGAALVSQYRITLGNANFNRRWIRLTPERVG